MKDGMIKRGEKDEWMETVETVATSCQVMGSSIIS